MARCLVFFRDQTASSSAVGRPSPTRWVPRWRIRAQPPDLRHKPGLPGRLLFVGCLTSRRHANVSHGRICSHNFMCSLTEIELEDRTFYFTKSQNCWHRTDPSQRWPYNAKRLQETHVFKSLVWLDPEKSPRQKRESNHGSPALKAEALLTRPTRRLPGRINSLGPTGGTLAGRDGAEGGTAVLTETPQTSDDGITMHTRGVL